MRIDPCGPEHGVRGALAAAAEFHRRRRVRRRRTAASSSPPTAARRGSRSRRDCPTSSRRTWRPQSNPESAVRDGRPAPAAAARRPRRRGGGAAASASTNRPTAATTGSWPCAGGRTRHTPDRVRSGASAAAICRRSPSIRRTRRRLQLLDGVWRTEDGGVTWWAVRGAPGGDDYQGIWVNPNNTDILLVVADQGAVISATAARAGATGTRSRPPRCITCRLTTPSRTACAAGSRTPGPRAWTAAGTTARSRSATGVRSTSRIRRSGVPTRKTPTWFTAARAQRLAPQPPDGQTKNVGPNSDPMRRADVQPQRAHDAARMVARRSEPALLRAERGLEDARRRRALDAHQRRPGAPDMGHAGQRRQYASSVTPAPRGDHGAVALAHDVNVLWAGTDDGNIQVTTDGGATWTNVTPPPIKPWTRIFNIEAGHFDTLTAYAAANTMRLDDLNPHSGARTTAGRRGPRSCGIAPRRGANSIREDPEQKGLLYAATDAQVWVSVDDGDHWQSLRWTCRRSRSATSVERRSRPACAPTCCGHARSRLLDPRQRHTAAAGGSDPRG